MIYIIAPRESNKFDSLKKYFKVRKFNSFIEFINTINNIRKPAHVPFAILCDEEINGVRIYDIINDNKIVHDLQRTPILIIKEQLEGHEFDHIRDGIIDDYVSSNTNVDDLIERIRFLLMHRYDIYKPELGLKRFKRFILNIDLYLRKIIDLTASFILLLLLTPLFILVGILIKLESRGPVFYLSFRAGNGYKIFRIIKFRTMHMNADKMLEELKEQNQYTDSNGDSTFFKFANDPRITKVGSFLRKTSIDELPQLINVLKGDMSLIGNRPLPLYEAEKLTRDFSSKRFAAPAGISGLWQVRKRGQEEMSEQERINLDVEYAEKYNILLDIKIFFLTFPAMLQKESV